MASWPPWSGSQTPVGRNDGLSGSRNANLSQSQSTQPQQGLNQLSQRADQDRLDTGPGSRRSVSPNGVNREALLNRMQALHGSNRSAAPGGGMGSPGGMGRPGGMDRSGGGLSFSNRADQSIRSMMNNSQRSNIPDIPENVDDVRQACASDTSAQVNERFAQLQTDMVGIHQNVMKERGMSSDRHYRGSVSPTRHNESALRQMSPRLGQGSGAGGAGKDSDVWQIVARLDFELQAGRNERKALEQRVALLEAELQSQKPDIEAHIRRVDTQSQANCGDAIRRVDEGVRMFNKEAERMKERTDATENRLRMLISRFDNGLSAGMASLQSQLDKSGGGGSGNNSNNGSATAARQTDSIRSPRVSLVDSIRHSSPQMSAQTAGSMGSSGTPVHSDHRGIRSFEPRESGADRSGSAATRSSNLPGKLSRLDPRAQQSEESGGLRPSPSGSVPNVEGMTPEQMMAMIEENTRLKEKNSRLKEIRAQRPGGVSGGGGLGLASPKLQSLGPSAAGTPGAVRTPGGASWAGGYNMSLQVPGAGVGPSRAAAGDTPSGSLRRPIPEGGGYR